MLTWDQRHERRIHILLLCDRQSSSYHLYYTLHTPCLLLITGGGRGQWLGGTIANEEHEPITGVWGQSPWSGGQGGEAALKLKAFWSLDV